ncbi:MAG: zinc-binding dehydrogenase [Saprospiraceae bacterium]
MQAWILPDVGSNLVLKDIPEPEATAKASCVVPISYSSVNHRDVYIINGLYPNIILPCTLGSDACGMLSDHPVVINPGIDWGSNESYQSEDYNILGMPVSGTFSEKICVAKNKIYTLPSHLSQEEGAAIPLAGVTAYRSLIVKGKADKNKRVLVTGIGGGVALWALKFALALGCEVWVTSSSEDKIKKAILLGATGGITSSEHDWSKTLLKNSGGFDLVVDSIMGKTLPDLVKLCLPGASICFYGASAGKTENFSPHTIFWRQLSILGSTMGSDLDFKNMIHFIEAHQVRPVIDRVYPFSDLPHALERMKNSQQFGKIILDHSL